MHLGAGLLSDSKQGRISSQQAWEAGFEERSTPYEYLQNRLALGEGVSSQRASFAETETRGTTPREYGCRPERRLFR